MEVKTLGKNYNISTKHAIAICNFIRNKTISEALASLEKVRTKKIAVPMKGEVPHKKGMAGGRYPVKAAFYFIKLLKNLRGNALLKNLEPETTIITLAKADKGPTGMRIGRKGRVGKSTHVLLIGQGKELEKTRQIKKEKEKIKKQKEKAKEREKTQETETKKEEVKKEEEKTQEKAAREKVKEKMLMKPIEKKQARIGMAEKKAIVKRKALEK